MPVGPESDRERPSRRAWARLALAVATFIGMIAVFEAGSYAFGAFDGPTQKLRVGALELYGRHDALLFWSLDPGARDTAGRRWINSAGLREPELPDKQPGEYRILSLGESTTFAAQLPYADSYSALLESRLAADRENPVRVLNAGVPGYSLFQGVMFLKERSAALEPDMVLLYFGFNNFLPVAYLAQNVSVASEVGNGRNDWEVFDYRQQPLQQLLAFGIRYSNLVRALTSNAEQIGKGSLKQNATRPRVPREHRAKLLRMAKEYADERGITLVVVVPIYAEFRKHIEELRTLARAESIPFVDLPAALDEPFSLDVARYFIDRVHPSRAGHRAIAEVIHREIEPLVPRSSRR